MAGPYYGNPQAKFTERKSGIVVPTEKPEEPTRIFELLEITDPIKRAEAKEALSKLWEAMDLSSCGRFEPPEKREAHEQVYWYIGKMLLGNECPEKEVLT